MDTDFEFWILKDKDGGPEIQMLSMEFVKQVYPGAPESFFWFKGTVSRDFLYPVFFTNQLLLVPLEMSKGRLYFFCFFTELLDF